jgi:hypothetical protein
MRGPPESSMVKEEKKFDLNNQTWSPLCSARFLEKLRSYSRCQYEQDLVNEQRKLQVGTKNDNIQLGVIKNKF